MHTHSIAPQSVNARFERPDDEEKQSVPPGQSLDGLFQPFQLPLATDDVLVVPLNISSLYQPSLQILYVDLVSGSVASFGGFERAFLLQPVFLKGPTAPEEEADTILQFAVPNNRISIQKPNRMGVPDLVFCLGQNLVDLPSQKIADLLIIRIQASVVFSDVWMHLSPSHGLAN
jgi:hypothetical protein